MLALTTLLLVSLVAPALAQPTEPKAQAEAKVVEARRLFEKGEYQPALDRLNEAQELFPSPKLQFNFGVVYRSLGREVEALQAFERFLEGAPDSSPARQTEAQRHVAELRGRVAFIDVISDLDGAEVWIDGHSHGKTPLATSIAVAAGAHQVLVQKEGVPLPYTERIEVRPGSRLRVQAPLARLARPLLAPTVPAEPAFLGLDEKPPGPAPAPLYKRWWFWTGVAAVAAGAVTVGILATRRSPGPICSDCNAGTFRVPGP